MADSGCTRPRHLDARAFVRRLLAQKNILNPSHLRSLAGRTQRSAHELSSQASSTILRQPIGSWCSPEAYVNLSTILQNQGDSESLAHFYWGDKTTRLALERWRSLHAARRRQPEIETGLHLRS
jgi:hypothetical protein